MTLFSRAADLARQQHRTISFEQLRALGFSAEAIWHLVRSGRMWRVFRGVYALEGPLEPIGWLKAAELRCGPRSMATLFSAAVLHRISRAWPLEPQLVVANKGGGGGPKGIDLHHSATLRRADVTYVDGIRTTALPRTIVDCARHLDDRRTKELCRQAEFHHGLDLTVLDRPGIPRTLRDVLDRYVLQSGMTASELEARFYELCAKASIPLPHRQQAISRFRIDFLWPDDRVIVETDGRSAHDRSIAFTEDRRRDRELTLAGWRVLRYTWAEIELEPELATSELSVTIRR